ncbi:single-stranded DNA-binding protein [SAR202 cluster bacterium AD-802-E10_MRT_200m]|nr:single-stranded DNA-binding protein [SAR202 cluster bacterium AD-802-E10_MRT_200m]
MAYLNEMTIIGNLGGDPEMRYTAQGIPMTTFSVAVNFNYNDASGERQSETEWFRVVTFRQLAEHCNNYLAKGRRAFVKGRLRGRSWQGADGQTRITNEIMADRVIFLDRATGDTAGSIPLGRENENDTIDADDLPF